jgi:4-amino-4-deoxy-L-arabinose transferase-like glycosyltransferase/cytochrome c-type biogenesis protein CcmH/NrfG
MSDREVNNHDEGHKIAKNRGNHIQRGFLIACIIFCVALTVRLIYLYESSANPSFQTPIVDSKTYDETARTFARNQILGSNFFWQPFFYPFFLSVVYFFSKSSIIAAKDIQVLLGALTCVLTYRLGAKIFGRRTGIIAGLVTAFYGPMFFYDGELLSTGWAAFWAVVIVSLFMEVKEKDKGRYWFFLGASSALGIITRPEFLLVFIAGCAWLWLRVPRELSLVPRFGAAFIGMALVLVPVSAAANFATGRFSIISSSGGLNLYIGNNPNYCDTLTIRPGEEWDRLLIKLPSLYGKGRSVWDEDRFFKQQVLEYVKKQPFDFAKGLGRKALEFVSSREIPRNLDIYIFGKWSRLLHFLTWKADRFGFPFGIILPLAVLGIIFNWRRIPVPMMLFIVFYPLSIIFVFVAGRYRVPMIPILAIVVAAGFVSVIEMVRLRQWRKVMITITIVAGIVLLSILPGPFCEEKVNFEPEFYQFVGHGLVKQGKYDKAMECLTEALRLKPDYNETYFYMGEALRGQGKLSEAIKCYRKALQMKLDDSVEYMVHNNLGAALMEQGNLDEAIEQYKETIRLKPDYPHVYNNLGVALEKQGKIEEAIAEYKEALRLKPDFPEARANLASVPACQDNKKALEESRKNE